MTEELEKSNKAWIKKQNSLPQMKIIACQVYERIFQTIIYEKAIEDNKELQVQVDEQQHNNKHLLEQWDIEE